MATFAASLGNVERVDVLPFHKMGEHKWRDRGLNYQLAGVEPPSDESREQARAAFHDAGLLVS
jgi:pyruvate formate lyase activating enzyme